jgi:hypothetical protein
VADILPASTFIIEDSDAPRPAWLDLPQYKKLGKPGRWMSNEKRRGQIFTLDRLYDALPPENPYVFHLEDDWEFLRGHGPFLGPSHDILNQFPHVWTVSLRGTECNGHPVVIENGLPVNMPYWQGGWGGCHFNPGLRRLADYEKLRSYGHHVGYGAHGCGTELRLSRMHLDKGFRIAVLGKQERIKHLGTISRACEPLPPSPNILLAVPATHAYEYADKTYGIDRPMSGRIEAVRDTWFKDVVPFPNVTAKFFYGDMPGVNPILPPDSMGLRCPDDYAGLPYKTQEICRYALRHGYDFLVKGDDDSIIYVDRLLRSGFDLHEQMGWTCRCLPRNHGTCNCYATGMCYTLSRRAMGLVASAEIGNNWAEDFWVGNILRQDGIVYARHPGWVSGLAKHYVDFPLPRNTVAAHSVRPEKMREWYADLEGK